MTWWHLVIYVAAWISCGVVGFLWGYRRGVAAEKQRLLSFPELMQKQAERRQARGRNISEYWRTFGKKTKPRGQQTDAAK